MKVTKLPFDKPVQIDVRQFNRLSRQFKDMFAWKRGTRKGEYLVKQWFPKFRKQMEDCIN